ncbi:MAG: tail fiber domain-containing protein [Acidobacteriota bacterium]
MSVKQITFAFVIVCALLATAAAQDSSNASAQSPSLTITAAAAGGRVRITAPSSVVQMHVEVYSASGEKLFDQEIRGGNVFDWHLQNGQGQRVAPGEYVCVVTAKSVSGKITQKIGTVSVEEKSASVQPAAAQQLSPAQAQTIGPVEENSSWLVAGEQPQTPTVIAHDGTDGQMTRGRGALTFRIGNFFTGDDREQMRLTEDGRLGIGTHDPRATLDVAGTIRAQRYLITKPKPVGAGVSAQDSLTSNATEPDEALLTGTGTQDRIAKWLDNADTLGDSAITEVGGNVGIGTTAPGSRLVVSSNSSNTLPVASGIARFADANGVQTAVFADSFGTNPIFNVRRANGTAAAPSAVQANQLLGVIGASGFGASVYSGTRARVGFFASENWTNTANGTFLTFNTTANGAATAGGTERLRIDNNGNAGIGTTAPEARLHVAGTSNAAVTPIAILESSSTQIPLSFRIGGTENARIRVNNLGNLFFATLNGADKDIFFRAGDDSTTDMFIQSSTGNVGIGTTSPDAKLEVVNGVILSSGSTGGRLTANNPNNQSASVNLDWFDDIARIRYGGTGAGSTGGFVIQGQGDNTKLTITNSGTLIAVGSVSAQDSLFVGDLNRPDPGAGTLHDLCAESASFTSPPVYKLALCSQSSIRYKEDVRVFTPGLDLVSRLRPVSFRWKGNRSADFGLVAEEVAKIEPLLVTHNRDGEIEGVKYNRIGVVLLNAVQEQQAQIKTQQQQLQAKDERIANLAERLARYESRLTSLERSVASGKRPKRRVTARSNPTGKRQLRRGAPSKSD